MFEIAFGFVLFMISICVFAAVLIAGPAMFAGHICLAILFACMLGMWLGVVIVARA